jgi:hypothetical protein
MSSIANLIARNHFPALILAALSVLTQFITVALAQHPDTRATAKEAPGSAGGQAKPPVRVTISKETTWITEPLRPDGYPDYLRYFNDKFSQGISPINNAAVSYVRAFGSSDLPQDRKKRFFDMLGIDPPTDDREMFLGKPHGTV